MDVQFIVNNVKEVIDDYPAMTFQDICKVHTIKYTLNIGPDKDSFLYLKLHLFSYPSILTCVLCAQKNRLIETFRLSSHSICCSREIKITIFSYALISGGLHLLSAALILTPLQH